MGCGKSKHDVVSGNTVSQSKKSNGDDHGNIDGAKNVDGPTTTASNPSVVQRDGIVKESEKAEASQSEKAEINVVIKESENVNDEEKVKETKVVTIAEDLKEKSKNVNGDESSNAKKIGETEELEQGQGKMILSDSQSHLNDGTIEGVITEGLSGTTVYYSPPHTNVKEENVKPDNVVIVEEKESVEETKKETTNVEIVTVAEETSIKEEVIPAVETEKVASVTEEIVAEATGGDSKTN